MEGDPGPEPDPRIPETPQQTGAARSREAAWLWQHPAAVIALPLAFTIVVGFILGAPGWVQVASWVIAFALVLVWLNTATPLRRMQPILRAAMTTFTALLFVAVIWRPAARTALEGAVTDFTMQCQIDARIGLHEALSGRPLPTNIVFLSPDVSEQMNVSRVIPQDKDGYLFQIRNLFKRCSLYDAGPLEATNISLQIRARLWDPIQGRWIGDAKVVRVGVDDLQPHGAPFDFGISNHGMFYSAQEALPLVTYHAAWGERVTQLNIPPATRAVLAQTMPEQPIQKQPFTRFSKCHIAGVVTITAPSKTTTVQLPPECHADALKREHDSWPKGAW